MSKQSNRSDLSTTSHLVATDLRAAERSIETAQRDLLAFMLNTTEANRAMGFAPAMAHLMIKPAAAALAALLDGQEKLSGDTHDAALRVARQLKLSVTDYGGGDPKPTKQGFFTGASAGPADHVLA